jgi:hypothetical protein
VSVRASSRRLRAAATASVAVTAAALSAAIGFSPAMASAAGVLTARTVPAASTILHGQVWNDVNRDGIKTAEEQKHGVAGVTITVRYPDNSVREAVTDQDGKYSIDKLSQAEVVVTVTPPVSDLDWRFSAPDQTKDEQNDSDFVEQYNADATPPYTGTDSFALDYKDMKRDAGISSDGDIPQPEGKGTVKGHVWNDEDHDGIFDDGEKGVAGAPVYLYPGEDATPAPAEETTEQEMAKHLTARQALAPDDISPLAITDKDGKYVFRKVFDGTYQIAVGSGPLVDGQITHAWKFSKADAGSDDTVDSDVAIGENDELAFSKAFTVKGNSITQLDALVYTGGDDEPSPSPSTSASPDPEPTPSATTTPSPGVTPSAGASAIPTASATPAPGGGGSLPVTGAAIGGFVGAAVLLISGGIALTVLARRRRSTPAA